MKPEAAAFLSSLSASGASPSSSSRREHHRDAATPPADSSSAGCMAGILRIVSRYHHRNGSSSRRRRFLTFRRSSAPAVIATDHKLTKHSHTETGGENKPRLACDVPRSPTIPSEIRRSSESPPPPAPGVRNSNHTTRQALVARLMGLDDSGGGDGDPGGVAAEQRRKLLGALEKCDEDLKALKEMIDEVKKSVGVGGGGGSKVNDDQSGAAAVGNVNNRAESGDDPSDRLPVLTEFMTRPHHHHQKSHASGTGGVGGGIPRQQKKKPGHHEEGIFFFDISTKQRSQAASRSAATIGRYHHPNPSPESVLFPSRREQYWISNDSNTTSDKKAMAESVERACSDIAWGQRREVGRIGLALQEHICKDLVEELLTEILGRHYFDRYNYTHTKYYDGSNDGIFHECQKSRDTNTLPFDACKRSLRF